MAPGEGTHTRLLHRDEGITEEDHGYPYRIGRPQYISK